jgi:hypothetical protein
MTTLEQIHSVTTALLQCSTTTDGHMATLEQTRKLTAVTAALAQCNRFIAIESAYSADLRPAETQQLLDWYMAERDRLKRLLRALWQQAALPRRSAPRA